MTSIYQNLEAAKAKQAEIENRRAQMANQIKDLKSDALLFNRRMSGLTEDQKLALKAFNQNALDLWFREDEESIDSLLGRLREDDLHAMADATAHLDNAVQTQIALR